jgi:hypothetical protein
MLAHNAGFDMGVLAASLAAWGRMPRRPATLARPWPAGSGNTRRAIWRVQWPAMSSPGACSPIPPATASPRWRAASASASSIVREHQPARQVGQEFGDDLGKGRRVAHVRRQDAVANERRDSACAVGLAWIEGGRVVRRESRLIRPPQLRFSPGNIPPSIQASPTAQALSRRSLAVSKSIATTFMGLRLRGHGLIPQGDPG